MTVEITPKGLTVPTIEFNIVGYGKFELPVLGEPTTPFGVTNAFGVFQSAHADEQKLAAWSMLIQTLADEYSTAVRVLSRLDSDTVAAVFAAWGEKSKEYDPSQSSSQP